MSVSPGRLLVVDWVPPRPGRTEGVMFVFDGGGLSRTQTAEIVVPSEELAGWVWCTLVEARERLSDLLGRRVEAAVRAHSDNHTAYLESGHRVA